MTKLILSLSSIYPFANPKGYFFTCAKIPYKLYQEFFIIYLTAAHKDDSAAAFGMRDGTSKSTLAPSILPQLLFPRHVLRPLSLITENTRCTTMTTMTLRHHAPFALTSFCYRRVAIAGSSSRRKRLP